MSEFYSSVSNCLAILAVIAIFCGGAVFAFSPVLRRFNKFMGFTMIFEGLALMLSWVIFTRLEVYYMPTYLLFLVMLLTAPFFYWFAVKFLLREKGAGKADYLLLSIVPVFVLLYIPVALCVPVSDRNLFFDVLRGLPVKITTGASVLLAFDTMAWVFFLVEQLSVQVYCALNISRYRTLQESYYSNLERKSFLPAGVIIVLMALRFLVCTGIVFFPQVSLTGWFPLTMTVVFAVFYIAVTLAVCRMKYTAEELGHMIEIHEAKAQLPVANDIIESRMNNLMEDKFFLNPDVNLMDISARIQVNSKYLSDYLRYHYGETFLTFVNRLRVEYAASLLEDRSRSIEEVAESSGFTNVSTFYRNFMKVKGISPSQYRNN